MRCVPYSSVVGSIMYAINILQIVNVASRYMVNLNKVYLPIVKSS